MGENSFEIFCAILNCKLFKLQNKFFKYIYTQWLKKIQNIFPTFQLLCLSGLQIFEFKQYVVWEIRKWEIVWEGNKKKLHESWCSIDGMDTLSVDNAIYQLIGWSWVILLCMW
jgi:hypothetical protein